MTVNGKKICDRCGHPAAFHDKRDPSSDVCEVCVNADHGEREGERYAAAQMFGAAAQTALALGVTKPELHAVLADALQHESRHELVDMSAGCLHEGRREDRRWLRRFDPITAEGEAA